MDPATGQILKTVADATAADALAALTAASHAQAGWARISARERAEFLRRAFDLLIARTETFATLITLEMGKSLEEARGEVRYAAEFLRWFSEEAARIDGRYQIAPSGTLHQIVSRKPVGPCLLITPWNFPLAMITRKAGPAIAAGCTMIVKPAELTPLTSLAFAAMMQETGLPDGVMNLITTNRAPDAAGALLEDTRLRKLSFTGSTRVGRLLLRGAARNILRTSMELGGNAPFIVCEDADLDRAVDGAVQAKLRNIGQACTAANRFYVHERQAKAFVARLAERFRAMPMGPGLAGEVIGPLINDAARQNVHALVLDAVSRGARLVTGGEIPNGDGYFYPPTLLADVPADTRIMREEIFGPVAPVQTFVDDKEAVELANDSDYGLAAYLFTENLDRATRMSSALETGMLGINTGLVSDAAAPFGGVKQSGLGREGGAEGISEYLTTQYTGIALPVR
ncbi:NAD-dependent succinate-semialdehyde dehydrogenase [Labrenzia sp. ac12]